jgi:hypothetical protein
VLSSTTHTIVLQRPVLITSRHRRGERTKHIFYSTSPTVSFHHTPRSNEVNQNKNTEYRESHREMAARELEQDQYRDRAQATLAD